MANEAMFNFLGRGKTSQALVDKYRSASHGHSVDEVFNAVFTMAIDAVQQGYGDAAATTLASALASTMKKFVHEVNATCSSSPIQ